MKVSEPIIDSPFYLNFLYFFNVERDFYECHEHGEYLWLNSGGSDFLKGLIQLAVSLYHLGTGNHRGAAIMLSRGAAYVSHFPPIYEGIEVPSLVAGIRECHRKHQEAGGDWKAEQVAQAAPFIEIVDEQLRARLAGWHPVELPDEDSEAE